MSGKRATDLSESWDNLLQVRVLLLFHYSKKKGGVKRERDPVFIYWGNSVLGRQLFWRVNFCAWLGFLLFVEIIWLERSVSYWCPSWVLVSPLLLVVLQKWEKSSLFMSSCGWYPGSCLLYTSDAADE